LANTANEQVILKDYWEPRECLRTPIAEIFHAAHLLDRAASAMLKGERTHAVDFVNKANMFEVREWTESLWGSAEKNPVQKHLHRLRTITSLPTKLEKSKRIPVRMPTALEKRALRDRYGYHCVFCGVPLVRIEVRKAFVMALPECSIWGKTNASQHAAFQCLWLQYDHLIPHSYGGDNSIENIVITCAPCNYGKDDWLIEELGLEDPRKRPVLKTSWDGLERVLGNSGVSSRQ
jgi:5-methylcytosine-specific restriction endonuclease McrA